MGKHLLLAIPDAKAVNAAAGINSMHSATDARIAMLLSIWPPQKKSHGNQIWEREPQTQTHIWFP
jgi:hypothetical protein